MKKLPLVLCLVFGLLILTPGAAGAAEKNNVILDTAKIMPPIRQPMTTATISVVIGSFEDRKAVRLDKLSLIAGGKKLIEKNIGKQLTSLSPTVGKGRFKDILKHRARLKSEQEAKDIKAKLETQVLQVNVKQAYPGLEPGDEIKITAVGDFSLDGQTFQIQSVYTATYEYPLPDDTEDGWYPGDGHVHTYYSNDNEDPLYSPGWVADEGWNRGLRWLILSDHSQQLDFSTWAGNRDRYDAEGNDITEVGEDGTGEDEWLALKRYVANNPLYFPLPTGVGLEMSTVDPSPSTWRPWDSHYLAYDLDRYVENFPKNKHDKWTDKWGDGNQTEKRTGQMLINDVNAAGGFGFLSHPFSYWYPWFQNWDYRDDPPGGTTGYTGMELISSSNWTYLSKWDELLLRDLPKTVEINEDGNFTSGGFAVGTSNSDGSMVPGEDYGYYGRNLTYIQTNDKTPEIQDVYKALKSGKVIATNGPLARFTVNGYGIGSKRHAFKDADLTVKVSWYSNSTFGPVSNLKLVWKGDTINRTYFPSFAGKDGYRDSTKMTLSNLGTGYFRLEAEFAGGRVAYTNPAFISDPNPVGRAKVSGIVLDKTTGEIISGATVRTYAGQSSTTDENGKYFLDLPVTSRGSYHTLVAGAPQHLSKKARRLFKDNTSYKLDFSRGAPGQDISQNTQTGGASEVALTEPTLVGSAEALPPYTAMDNPDDNHSSASSMAKSISTAVIDPDLPRVALKKGKTKVLLAKKLSDAKAALDSIDGNAPPEDRAGAEGDFAHAWAGYDKYETEIMRQIDEGADVAILARGYFAEAQALLKKFKEPSTLIDPDFSPRIAENHPVLVIPSHGLAGLADSESFRVRLAEYAKAGGTIINLVQQWGREYAALPGGQISGAGWREAMACRWGNTEIDTFNPALAGIPDNPVSTNHDGYFTAWPPEAQILLRGTRRAGGQPVMLAYPYGQGRVVVSSIYPDWSFGMGAETRYDRAVFRDLVSWAKSADSVPEYRPGEPFTARLKIKNAMSGDSAGVRLRFVSPDRKEVTSTVLPAALSSKEETEVSYSGVAPDSSGIHYIDYELLDENGAILQPRTEGTPLAVSRFGSSPGGYVVHGTKLDGQITMADEFVPSGSDAVFTVSLTNQGTEESTFTAEFDDRQESLFLAPGETKSFSHRRPAVTRMGSLAVKLFDEAGRELGGISKRYWVFAAKAGLGISSGSTVYKAGQGVPTTVTVANQTPARFPAVLAVKLIDPVGRQLDSVSTTLPLEPEGTGSVALTPVLPPDAISGYYLLSADLYHGLDRIASGVSVFRVPEIELAVKPRLPENIVDGRLNFSIDVKNVGLSDADSAELEVALTDPKSGLILTEKRMFSIAAGQAAAFDFSANVADPIFGDYKISYTLGYSGQARYRRHAYLPNRLRVRAVFDKSFYRARDNVGLAVELENDGVFTISPALTVAVPDLGFNAARIVESSPDQSIAPVFTIPVPDNPAAGRHKVEVSLALNGTTSEKTAWFVIPDSKLELGLAETTVGPGGPVALRIKNVGGIDTTYSQSIRFSDPWAAEIYANEAGDQSIRVGEEKLFSFGLPPGLATGRYRLDSVFTDLGADREFRLTKPIDLSDISVDLSTKTGQESYMKGDNVSIETSITNLGSPLADGTLTLELHAPGQAQSEVKFAGQWGSFYPQARPLSVFADSAGYVYVIIGGDVYSVWDHDVKKYDSSGRLVTKFGGLGSGPGQLNKPGGVAVDSLGNIFVADTGNNRIQKFDSEGAFVSWQTTGNATALNAPVDIAVDPLDDTVYVLNRGSKLVQKFDSDGRFLRQWGGSGWRDNQFYRPVGLAIDGNQNVYVLDHDKNSVHKFDPDGQFLLKWGRYGTWDGVFKYPTGISADLEGNVYVADDNNSRIQKFNANGSFLAKWGSWGSDNGAFKRPRDVAVDSSGNIYVADWLNERIQKFTSDRTYSGQWLARQPSGGQFRSPGDIAVDTVGNVYVYVADSGNNRIQKFDSAGAFVAEWGSQGSGEGQFGSFDSGPGGLAVDFLGNVYAADTNNNRYQKFDSQGTFLFAREGQYVDWRGKFKNPEGVAVDRLGNVYVADTQNGRVQKFDADGNYITQWGSIGKADGQFGAYFYWESGRLKSVCGLHELAVDSANNVYAVDGYNHRVQKFDANGNLLLKWGSFGTGPGQFNYPYEISTDHEGYVYVVDTGNRIQKFGPDGNFITEWGGTGSGEGQFNSIGGLAVDLSGNVYVADRNNYRVQKFSQTADRAVLWQTELPVSLASGESTVLPAAIGSLNTTGKLYLNATVKNALGQPVAKDSYPFYVYPGDTAMTLQAEKKDLQTRRKHSHKRTSDQQSASATARETTHRFCGRYGGYQ